MTNITNPRLLYFKAVLFLLTGLLSAGLLILEFPTVRIALLLALAIWCFCRAYYFAFYVIEHYVDAGYRFSGLGSFLCYLLRKRRGEGAKPPPATDPPSP
jgi:hypothetical protein